MKAIVTAVHGDGAQWGWPGEPVYRYLGEDGSWAWVPQPKHRLHTVGEIYDEEGGWEWLDESERKKKIDELRRTSSLKRDAALVRLAKIDGKKKTGAQLDREITEATGVTVRHKNKK